MSRWIDVSQPLHNHIPVWPGDTAFDYHVSWPMSESESVNVGSVTMSIHTGTHIDAPFHFDNGGETTENLDVNIYIGPARVLHLPSAAVLSSDALANVNLRGCTRLLIRTDAWPDKSIFPSSIPPVDPDFARFLSDFGVKLLGLDLPSVDPFNSKLLPAHHALARHGIHILEGLVLDAIEPGDYELAAVPLSLVGADGSPVRALLRSLRLNQSLEA